MDGKEGIPFTIRDSHLPVRTEGQLSIDFANHFPATPGRLFPRSYAIRKLDTDLIRILSVVMNVEEVPWHKPPLANQAVKSRTSELFLRAQQIAHQPKLVGVRIEE